MKRLFILIVLAAMLGGGSAIDINSSGSLQYYNDGTLELEVDGDGNVNLQGDLSVGSANSLTNYYENSCTAEGKAVTGIYANGTTNCTEVVTEDLGVENLSATLESGNVANQSIDLNGFQLEGVTDNSADDAVNRSRVKDIADNRDDTIADDQDLQYSLGNQPTSQTEQQEIGITDGANITFEDLYEPDDQALTLTNDSQGVNDLIAIDNGNSILVKDSVVDSDANPFNELQSLGVDTSQINDTVSISSNNTVEIYDQYRDSDADPSNEIQNLQTSGDQITLSQDGTTIYVPYANNSDTLDSREGSYYNQTVSVESSSTDDVISLSTGSSITIDDDFQDADADPTNEYQNLSGVLSNGTSTGSYNINVNGNNLSNPAYITSFFQSSACGDGEVVDAINADGSYECVPVSGEISTPPLSEVLAEENFAEGTPIYMNQSGVFEIGSGNTNITGTGRIVSGDDVDLGSNDLDNVNAIYSGSGSTNFFSGGASSSETVTGISSSGTLQTSSILVGTSNLEDLAVTDNKIALASINRSQIENSEVTSSELNSAVAGSGLSGGGGSPLAVNTNSDLTVTSDDVEIASGGVDSGEIADGTVLEVDLSATNSATDNQYLTYDSGSGGFTWVNNPDTDDQDLQYSSSVSNAESQSQEIGITNGANITFQDAFNPNQTISGDLAYNNDTITLSDGSTATVYDRFRDSDADPSNEIQSIQLDGNQVYLSQDGTRVYVPYANNTDTVDDVEASYLNTTATVDSSSTDDVIQLSNGDTATIDDDFQDADSDPTNEYQNLSGVLSNGTGVGTYNIDLNNNEIQNFFSNQCSGTNEVVKRVYANGSYVCETVPEDTGVEDLSATLEAGAVANQSIDMSGNQIQDASKVGVKTASPSQDLDVDGSASVESSGTEMEVNSNGNVVVTLGP